MKIILLLTVLMAAFNTGLIWTVQLVHYPGFLKVGQQAYVAYQQFHMKRILMLVGPSMVLELLFSTWLLFDINKASSASLLVYITYGLLLLIWLHTAFWAAPLHGKLKVGFNEGLIRRLILVNWIRTILWSLRTVILGYLLLVI